MPKISFYTSRANAVMFNRDDGWCDVDVSTEGWTPGEKDVLLELWKGNECSIPSLTSDGVRAVCRTVVDERFRMIQECNAALEYAKLNVAHVVVKETGWPVVGNAVVPDLAFFERGDFKSNELWLQKNWPRYGEYERLFYECEKIKSLAFQDVATKLRADMEAITRMKAEPPKKQSFWKWFFRCKK